MKVLSKGDIRVKWGFDSTHSIVSPHDVSVVKNGPLETDVDFTSIKNNAESEIVNQCQLKVN